MMLDNEIYIGEKYTRVVRTDRDTKEPIISEAMVETEKLFNETFYNNLGYQTGILPKNCKYIKNFSNGKKLFVIEEEPQVRTVSFNISPEASLEFLKRNGKYDLYGLSKFKREMPYSLRLSFPYIVYVINTAGMAYNGMNVFFRLHPITSLGDYLLKPCIPNLDEHSRMCLGFNMSHNINDTNELITEVINNFWFNNFNNDYSSNVKDYENTLELCDYFTWAYNSKVDPLFIFSVKWLTNKYYPNLKSVIDHYSSNSNNSTNIVNSLSSTIKRNLVPSPDGEKIYEIRDMRQSIVLIKEPNIFVTLSIGDEVQYKDKTYYIESFISSSFDDIGIILDGENEKIEIDLQDQDVYDEFVKQFEITNPTSFQIGEQTVNQGDIIKFKDSGNIKILEKIIKTRDNKYQVKIGRYFYLDSCFLDNNIEKVNEIQFCGQALKEGDEYYITNMSDSYYFFQTLSLMKFKEISPNDNELHLVFTTSAGKRYVINYNETEDKLINLENLRAPEFYRVNDKIYTNQFEKKEFTTYLIQNSGIGFCRQAYLRDDYSSLLNYNRQFLTNSLKQFCEEKKTSFVIPSFDRDVNYNIGDEVIYINWENPSSMLQVQVISGFSVTEKEFSICLKNNENQEQSVQLINLETGFCNVASIRHVCKEAENLTVGTRVKSTTSICDFPMKDCNEICAFIIDDIEPLVLFSNYRTLPLRTVLEYFTILKPGTKEYQKSKLSTPNLKIKIQDGDLFYTKENGKMICFVHTSRNSSRTFVELINGNRGRRGYVTTYSPRYHSHWSQLENRYGLLLPRHTDEKMKMLPSKSGNATVFSTLVSVYDRYNDSYRIRRDWKGEY